MASDTLSGRVTRATRHVAVGGSVHVAVEGEIARRQSGNRATTENGNSADATQCRRVIRAFPHRGGRRAQTEAFTDDGTVPRNRPRQGALSSTATLPFRNRESSSLSRLASTSPRAAVTSASINGTLDVTRRPNFPGSSRWSSRAIRLRCAPYRRDPRGDPRPSATRPSRRFVLRIGENGPPRGSVVSS